MKIHVCCGEVYLRDYINIDIQGRIRTACAVDTAVLETTFDKYYTKPHTFTVKEIRGDFVIDERVDILASWPWPSNIIDEVVMIQAIEHFTLSEGEYIITEIYRVLKPGGEFIFDFPDIIETFNQYKNDFDRLVQLIYCHHKDAYASHKVAYDEESFAKLLRMRGRQWSHVEFKDVVKHDYPTIGGIARK